MNSPLRQSVSDSVGGDCGGPATASSAPREKRKGGNRKTWGRVGSDPGQAPQDTRTGTPSSTTGSSTLAVQEGDNEQLYAFEANQQPPQQQQQPGQARRTTPRPGAAAAAVSSSNSSSGTRSTRLEALPPPSPDACSGCFGTPPQQDGGSEAAVTGSGLPNPRLSPKGRGYSRGPRSDASATASSGSGGRNTSSGSGGKKVVHDRRRIATTPVWKRPAVPLSKPYVPVPRKESGGL